MKDSLACDFECQCDEEFRSACKYLTFYGEYEGKQYCVLHYPSEKKTADTKFQEALQKKKQDKDFDFSGVYFPSTLTEFKDFEFKTPASFSGATFSGAANFNGATFSERAFFDNATFSEWANFNGAFSEWASFGLATFSEWASFYKLKTLPETLLSLAGATIEKPERISFHTTYLRPSGFVDVDAQKFDFSDVEWFRLPSGEALTIEAEAKILADKGIEPPGNLRKFQKACRRLMNNAEDNRDYPTANEFHYWSMEAQRKEGWSRLGLIATLYWALSGYGERPRRAFLMLVGMWVLFAILYMVVGHPELRLASDLGVWQFVEHVGRVLVYSLAAIARLNPFPQPDGPGLFQFLVAAEGILGPLQIALFALAVRRKVMR